MLAYWTKKESRLRVGRTLRTRSFHVIVGRALGSPKSLTAWRGEDLEAIQRGEEGVRPGAGKTKYAKSRREAARAKAEAVLQSIRPFLPQLAHVGLAWVLAHGVSRGIAFELKSAAGPCSEPAPRASGGSYRLLPGQKVPGPDWSPAALPAIGGKAAEEQTPVPQPSEQTAESPPRPAERRFDPDVDRRKRVALAGWNRGEYASRAEAGKAHGFHRSDAAKIIRRHEACRK